MALKSFPSVPLYVPDEGAHRRQMAQALNRINEGKINAIVDWTLTASVAATTFSDARLTDQTCCLPMARTANAAAELGNGTWYIPDSGRVNGSVVVTHANNAQTDRDFYVAIIG